MSRGRKLFTILAIIIVIAALSLGGYLLYNYVSNYMLTQEAAEAVDEFESIITVAIEDEEQIEEEPDNQGGSVTGGTSTRRTSVTYKGYPVVGTIEIPRTGVKYPIVNDTSPAAMETAIVFLYGPGLNQVGNSVIVGHNYRNGGFFGGNKKLADGDLIYITDTSGNKIAYTIYRKYETSDIDFSYATRDTNGKREISLSTCTNDASTRLVIWAKEN